MQDLFTKTHEVVSSQEQRNELRAQQQQQAIDAQASRLLQLQNENLAKVVAPLSQHITDTQRQMKQRQARLQFNECF